MDDLNKFDNTQQESNEQNLNDLHPSEQNLSTSNENINRDSMDSHSMNNDSMSNGNIINNSINGFNMAKQVNHASGSDESDSHRTASYYTENYTGQPKKKSKLLLQMIAVALISSIFGGAVVGSAFMFVAPSIQSTAKGYFDQLIPGRSPSSETGIDSGVIKKVEIEKSDSPVSAIAEKVGPSVVGIRATYTSNDFFFGQSAGGGEGSGIIIRNDGMIVTNYHVIGNTLDPATGKLAQGSKIEVFLPSQIEKPYPATIIGYDSKTDLAVIKINEKNLPAAELGNSDNLKPGEMAVAIGNPGGMELMGSVTVGVISGLNRTIPLEGVDTKELKLIQTDAAINPGNSGGALVNSKGEVIGINNAKMASQGFEGLGFAIPINKAKEITDSLITNGKVKGRPYLGITVEQRYNDEIAKKNNLPSGVYVADVQMLSGAYKAGIKSNDIITKFGGKAIKSFDDLEEAKKKYKAGDAVSVEIYRDGKYLTLKVTLTEALD